MIPRENSELTCSRGPTLLKLRKALNSGFTLVEVTLAMGIASVALVTMVGTMAVGLTTVKDASDDAMHAQIMTHVTSSILNTPFDKLDSFVSGADLYFDQAGRNVETAAESIYRVDLTDVTNVAPVYPGAPQNLDASAKTVRIEVSTRPPGAQKIVPTSSATVIIPHS